MLVIWTLVQILAFTLGLVRAQADSKLEKWRPCMSYSSISSRPPVDKSNLSAGPLKLPYMRPRVECRTFNSTAVEKVVSDMTSRMKDKDLARLFENTFPNTLDTTIKWFNDDLAFVVTGDIPAEWLRDASNQFKPYLPLLDKDTKLKDLTRGVINLQARYITQFPYCNAFQPPPESGLRPQCCSGDTGASIFHQTICKSSGLVEYGRVFYHRYSFLQLSRLYYKYSKDVSIFTYNQRSWFSAVEAIAKIIVEQSLPTFKPDGRVQSFYNISGPNQQYMRNKGRGPPKRETGMVGTTYRPSDDVVIFPYNIPHQAMLVVELRELAAMLRDVGVRPDLAKFALERAKMAEDAVWKYAVVERRPWGRVFAYEVDGYGGVVIQDDANVPSLISLPYLGFVNATNEVYQNTRRMLLSQEGNPYYGVGPVIRGIGGQHIDEMHPWPMGIVSEVITGISDKEILEKLELLKTTTSGLGLIHESVNTHDAKDFTRTWFAWANSYFSEAILHLAENRPHLLFHDKKPYRLSDVRV